MTDKEKIIEYIDKLLEKYPKNYYLLTVAEFIDNLEVKKKLLNMLQTSVDNQHFFEQLDEYIDELENKQ